MLEVKVFDEEVLGVRLLEAQAAEVQTLDDQRSRNVFVLWMMFNDARGVASEPLSWWASMGRSPGLCSDNVWSSPSVCFELSGCTSRDGGNRTEPIYRQLFVRVPSTRISECAESDCTRHPSAIDAKSAYVEAACVSCLSRRLRFPATGMCRPTIEHVWSELPSS